LGLGGAFLLFDLGLDFAQAPVEEKFRAEIGNKLPRFAILLVEFLVDVVKACIDAIQSLFD
jgi:hypothetical protein